MTEEDSKYTERQIALVEGKIQPASNEEWSYVQEHANGVLPEKAEATETAVTKPGFVIVPPGKELNLHKPKKIGIPSWQEQQEKNS